MSWNLYANMRVVRPPKYTKQIVFTTKITRYRYLTENESKKGSADQRPPYVFIIQWKDSLFNKNPGPIFQRFIPPSDKY